MDFRAHRFLHVFFIFAFFMAQVSPACAFISGKSGSLEVCGADGVLRAVNVPASYDLSDLVLKTKGQLPDDKQKPAHSKANDCGFCFAQTHMTKALTSAQSIDISMPLTATIRIGARNIAYHSYLSQIAQPRAPPHSFA